MKRRAMTLSLVAAVLACLMLAPGALARGHRPQPQPPATGPVLPPVSPVPTALPPAPTASTQVASGGAPSAPDISSNLGIVDITCGHLAGASAEVTANCTADQRSQSAYPPGNYGTDTNVDTGTGPFGAIPDPAKILASFLQNVTSWAWSLFATVVTGVIAVLSAVFTFDLFRSGMPQIASGLLGGEQNFMLPLLPVALGVGGFAMAKHLASGNTGKLVSHTAAMCGLTIGCVLVIANLGGTLGYFDNLSNGLAAGAVGAFTGGSPTGGAAAFANSEPGLWKAAVEEPWCAAEFGDVNWCMAPIDPQMAAARDTVLQNLGNAAGDQAPTEVAQQQAGVERQRLADARTNGELFLSFPVNWTARNGKDETWSLFHALLKEHPELGTIRGAGGVSQHLLTLVLGAVAGVGFLLVLGFIAVQLLAASFTFVVALLALPVAVLLVASEKGREMFMAYVGFLFLALFQRVIYSVVLGVLMLSSNVLFDVTGRMSWFFGWIVVAAFWWIMFSQRHQPMRLLGRRHTPLGQVTTVVRTVGSAVTGSAVGAASAGARRRPAPPEEPRVAAPPKPEVVV